ncbi:zinc finger, CCHC-type containing protein [Tanacetum coccineum]|uniref:Zinc finger, CCHC-type containing protein n=1 Tax=Tanacetum coccineum TaxID=301880 RepID=A0ABQ5H582_9ASTR
MVAAMKHMASSFAKLEKFEGVDFRRWQKNMHFMLSSMSVVYVLTTLMPKDGGENPTVEQVRKRAKWDNDDYDTLEAKYMAKDASSKKFFVSNFTNYKMTDSRPVLEQYNEILGILGRFTQNKMNMDESIQESLRTQNNDKPKGNNIAGPSVVNMVEHNNSSRYNDNKGKRKHHDTRDNPNKKLKVTYWKCGKPGHLKKDCKAGNVGNRANGSGTKGSEDGSSNPLKGQNMFDKSPLVYYVTYVSEAFFVQDDDVAWWVDSGATVHVCKDGCWFKTYESLNDGSILHMGNESTALVHGRGCVDLRFSSRKVVSLLNVLHVPNIRKNLVSSSVLNNYVLARQVIESNKFVLSKHGVFIGFGYQSNHMFRLNIVSDNIGSAFMSTSKLNDSILWHARLGHVHFKRMQDMFKDGLISAFDMDTRKCQTCMPNKINKKPFQNVKRETKVLELIHSDLCDLHATPSLGNKKYFVTFIDDASRFCYVYLLHTKDEALDKFKSVGIIHETPALYTPQQNSISKRKNRVLKEMVNSMLSYSGLSQGFWGEAMVVVRFPDPKLKTLGERGIECIFVGYAEHSKAFRPSQRSLVKGTKDSGGLVVPEKDTKEDEVYDQYSYCFNVEDDPKTFDEAMKLQTSRLQMDLQKKAEVARTSTIRLLIAMASIHSMIIYQMDVKITFLNGELKEEVYMNQPLGFIMPADKCVYSKFDKSGKGVIICLYVDDMLIFGTDQVQVDLTKEFLSSRFSMKDMGDDDVILGLAPSQLEYSRVIGFLMYSMNCTRPDITFVVGKLSRYTSNPDTQHWQAIQKVLKYLKKTMDYRLMYTGYPLVLEGYSDASWIGNTKYNSYTSGWVFLLGDGAISWASKKQTCITGSIMESEFVALAAAGKEAEWLKNLLLEIPLWVKPMAPISICCDSAATLAKAYSQMYNGKSRHLGVRHSMIRELITNRVALPEEYAKGYHHGVIHQRKHPQRVDSSAGCRAPLPREARMQWELKLPLHSCSLPGSTNAMEVSIWGGRLHFRKVEE